MYVFGVIYFCPPVLSPDSCTVKNCCNKLQQLIPVTEGCHNIMSTRRVKGNYCVYMIKPIHPVRCAHAV